MRHERAKLAPDRPWSARGSLECPLVRFNDTTTTKTGGCIAAPPNTLGVRSTCPGADFRRA